MNGMNLNLENSFMMKWQLTLNATGQIFSKKVLTNTQANAIIKPSNEGGIRNDY